MLILTSPSKTQDFSDLDKNIDFENPLFLDKTKKLYDILKDFSEDDLKNLMSLSDNLASQVKDYYNKWSSDHKKSNSKPALFAFKGDVYRPLELDDYNEDNLEYAQKRLKIISGFYGVLRPLDLIKPYRLEFKTKLKVGNSDDLYAFWTKTLTSYINKCLQENNFNTVLNLASQEYFKALDKSKIKASILKVNFKEKKDSGLRTIPIYAKKARGYMINYCIRNKIESRDQLKKFNVEGYTLHSENEKEMTFVR